MDISGAIKEIKAGKYRPIYVLVGQDRYRMAQFVDYISNAMFQTEEREMGIVKFDTAETPLEDIVLEAESLPFLLERKLIVVRDAVVLTGGSGKEGSKIEHRPDSMLRYLEQPLESSVIVFVVQAEKLDERRKLVKLLKERQSVIPFYELDGAQMKQWIIKRAQEQGRSMTEQAAELLQARVGNNMQQLSQEVDKLCLHAGSEGAIDEETVGMLTSVTIEEDVFALVDAIAELRIENALRLYRNLLVRREEPIKIVALIVRQIRMMLQIKELEKHHYSPQQMAGQIGQHPYAVKLASEKGRKFTIDRLAGILASLAELDYKMKTGLIDKALGVELFLLSLHTEQEAGSKA
ncbi:MULTISPECIES: DNA polymerase III subunit delta [unclassified Paenibacillus]|uniref:DNA polymerase III subunit delta n=1 Tax=unclassified Paenibacillus TaxID=185978 RepID=UPI002F41C9D5